MLTIDAYPSSANLHSVCLWVLVHGIATNGFADWTQKHYLTIGIGVCKCLDALFNYIAEK